MSSSFWFILAIIGSIAKVYAVLHSNFLQPGNGIIKETWYNAKDKSLETIRDLKNFPTCPHLMKNLDNFNDPPRAEGSKLKYIVVRYKGYFIPSESGNHRFYVRCREMCSLSIEQNPLDMRKIIEVSFPTSSSCWDCNASQRSREIKLVKSVRYYIEMLAVGEGSYDFASLGVRKPSYAYERPIQKKSLWRTISLYYWHGFLGEFYNIKKEARPDLNTVTSKPTQVSCIDKTYYDRNRDYFAMRVTGFFLPATTGNYKIYLRCNHRCEFYVKKANGTEIKVAEQNNDVSVEKHLGRLQSGSDYYMRISYYKDKGRTRFSVKSMRDITVYDYFKSIETRTIIREYETIPDLQYSVVNSTSVILNWTTPSIPTFNNFTLTSYKIRFWSLIDPSTIQTITFQNTTSATYLAAGLGIWTQYEAEIFYIGIEYILKPKELIFRTGEDVPTAPPSHIYFSQITSVSVTLAWFSIPFKNHHGVLIGYEIAYTEKGQNKWMNVTSNTVLRREKLIGGLKKFSEYEFKVAGKTSAGIGVFSPAITYKTKEDAPTLAPTNVNAHNLSATVMKVTWGLVPFDGRNGIIRVYVIYYKLQGAPESEWRYVKASASVNSTLIFRLKYWSFYEIKVAAKTVSEGVKSSAVVARTDEHVPSQDPQNVTGIPTGSRSINISWSAIPYEGTNGIITGYWIEYGETNGYIVKDKQSIQKYLYIQGLEEYFDYTIRVAGITSKGVGIFSDKIKVRTLQDVSSGPPENIRMKNTSSTSLLVSWQQIPLRQRNGIIIGYKIDYRETKTLNWASKTVDKQMSVEITGLEKYRWYEMRVNGRTSQGVGIANATILVLTDEDLPAAPPTNFTGRNVTSRSIVVFWSSIPLLKQNGIIVGYRVQLKDAVKGTSKWFNATFDSNARNGTIYELQMFHPYFMKIAGMTSKGVGIFSDVIKVWTDEDAPGGFPMNITGNASSSTSLSLAWQGKQTNASNGIVIGYKVFYHVFRCPEDRPSVCSESTVMTARTNNATTHITLTDLFKFTEYLIWIRVLNSVGTGPPSPKYRTRTGPDKPSSAPEMVESFSRTFTSIQLFWDPIKESKRNGIIMKYRTFYKLQESEILKSHRVVRSIGDLVNDTIEGLMPGESFKDVNGSHVTVVIDNLQPYRWYVLRIGALTTEGLGPTVTLNASCLQSVAAKAPPSRIIDKYSFTEITVDWSQIKQFNQSRGTILEYHIEYWPVEIHMKPVIHYEIIAFNLQAPVNSTKLRNLGIFTKYAIRVAAVTQTGIGAYTDTQYGETCRCEKSIQIIKRVLPPLISKEENDTFTAIIDDAVKSCCSTCTSINTTVSWEIDTHGEGVLSADDVFEELQKGKEIYAPQLQKVHSWWHLGRSYHLGTFVPVIHSPGVALIGIKVTEAERNNEGARMIWHGLVKCYPILVLSVLGLAIFGYLHWLLELGKKRSSFSDGIKEGLPQAVWFSFVTHSTVGYGDLLPSTFVSRCIAILSILTGILWRILLIASIIITNLALIQEKNIFPLAGKRVAVTNQTHLLAVQRGGNIVKVVSYTQPFDAIDAVIHKVADVALIDSLSILANDTLMKNEELEIRQLININQYYGVIMSGKTERLSNCVHMYMQSNKNEIERKAGSHYRKLWKMIKADRRQDKANHILGKEATIFKAIFLTVVVLIILAAPAGYILERKLTSKNYTQVHPEIEGPTTATDDEEELMRIVESFVKKMDKLAVELDLKHAKQRIKLAKENYAVNIVPDVIELFGNADFESDMRKHKEAMEEYQNTSFIHPR